MTLPSKHFAGQGPFFCWARSISLLGTVIFLLGKVILFTGQGHFLTGQGHFVYWARSFCLLGKVIFTGQGRAISEICS